MPTRKPYKKQPRPRITDHARELIDAYYLACDTCYVYEADGYSESAKQEAREGRTEARRKLEAFIANLQARVRVASKAAKSLSDYQPRRFDETGLS